MIESNRDDYFARMDRGIKRGVARALRDHKRDGVPIVVLRDGKVVEIPPEEIVFDEELLEDDRGHR